MSVLILTERSAALYSSRGQVLSALDAHTARWIVEKCFKSDLVQGRTVLLIVRPLVLLYTQPIPTSLPDT